MPLDKQDPECYNAEYGITEWSCGGECDPIIIQGEIEGYKSLCPECFEAKDKIFEYPCQDKFCLGDHVIRLKGSQVAGHYRNMSEKPDWIFPPIRCKECRDWLAGVAQMKKSCTACKSVFVVPASVIKNLKKYEGDPEVCGPQFCPRCAAMTEEEREAMLREQESLSKQLHEQEVSLRKDELLSDSNSVDKKGHVEVEVDRLLSNLREQDVSAMLQPKPIEPRSTIDDLLRYGREPVKEWDKEKKAYELVTRSDHLQKHSAEFRPPAGNIREVLAKADEIMKNATIGEVLTLADRRMPYSLKIEVKTGNLVVYRSQGDHPGDYISVSNTCKPGMDSCLKRIDFKVEKSDWTMPS